jgi:hypothetical protein
MKKIIDQSIEIIGGLIFIGLIAGLIVFMIKRIIN